MKSTTITSILLPKGVEIYLESLRQRKMSQETERGYAMDLKQFMKHVSKRRNGPVYIDEVTVEDAEAFHQTFIDRGAASATVRRKLNAISSFFSFAVRKGWVAFNPADGVERIPIKHAERVFLDADEIQAIMKNIDHDIIYHFIVMMANTGLRVKECANLTLNDVDLEKGIVSVIEGKGGKDRQVPMNDELKRSMKFYKEEVRPDVQFIRFFATKKTGAVSPQYVNVVLKKAAKNAGIKKTVTTHVLRHSFASQLVKNQTHVAVIQRLLGHADVRTTSIYMHAHTEDLETAVDSLSFINETRGEEYDVTT